MQGKQRGNINNEILNEKQRPILQCLGVILGVIFVSW
jgi:hypothetical protein